ncbi:hypothetical protein AMAG_11475 [Allomyces macrogynus ATCC 38327]|uniref:Uncharacterized protein n=1 Tax=Allomyces macrogynus (strain ATCC 38327) TaxID=578462 RepID=A0A0L0SWT8_ALLM3|nr:hypothetical protein AMAG_11475 [Allomyces macrogynus ATCC 38327]|eukprot:KNE67008.1 hypothetical protein AMAG_11475 [Allomyces macrogynus ATCC 38327]
MTSTPPDPAPAAPAPPTLLGLPPEVVWNVFDYLGDADLRPLADIAPYAAILSSRAFVNSRRARLHRLVQSLLTSAPVEPAPTLVLDGLPVHLALPKPARADAGFPPAHGPRTSTVRRLAVPDLVHRRLIPGGAVALNVLANGGYLLGPEHAQRVRMAAALSHFFVRRKLARRLDPAVRPPVEGLVATNILPARSVLPLPPPAKSAMVLPAMSTAQRLAAVPRIVRKPVLARALAAPLVALHRAQVRDALARKLAARPAWDAVKARGVVPVHTLAAPCAAYLSLLPRQVSLAAHLARGKLAGHLSARPRTPPAVVTTRRASVTLPAVPVIGPLPPSPTRPAGMDEDLDAFLRKRVPPSTLVARNVLTDRDVAALLAPSVQGRIRFFESLAVAEEEAVTAAGCDLTPYSRGAPGTAVAAGSSSSSSSAKSSPARTLRRGTVSGTVASTIQLFSEMISASSGQ